MKTSKYMLPWRLLAVAAMMGLFWIPAVHGGPLSASEMAPDFSLPDLSGEMVSLKDFRGNLVLVDFWATWCVPCRKSLPELAALEKKYRNQGVTVLGLSVDNPDSFDNQYIKDFLEKYKVAYRILRADQSVIHAYLGKDYPKVPTLFIIDGQGRILKVLEGYTGNLASEVEPFIQKP